MLREAARLGSFFYVAVAEVSSIYHRSVMVSGVEPRTTGTSMQSTMRNLFVIRVLYL